MKDIQKENINSNFTSDEAVFSSQYRRRLYIKHFLLTKRGAGLLLFMAFLNYIDMLHVYSIIFFLMVIVALYIKNKDLIRSYLFFVQEQALIGLISLVDHKSEFWTEFNKLKNIFFQLVKLLE